jgi:cell wall-associated NlpC family hydrolase
VFQLGAGTTAPQPTASGFDCSGLIAHVFEQAWDMLLPPGTVALSRIGMAVKLKELEPGDLVF